LSAVLAAAPESSVGQSLDLEWEAPGGCPAEDEVRGAIDRYLGRENFGAEIREVRVRGAVESVGGQKPWQLRVQVDLPSGTVDRQVAAARCEQLTNAAGLVIAVALDPLRVSDEVVPVAEIETRPEPAAEPPPPAAPERKRWADLRLGAAGEIGTLPRLGAGLWLAVALVGKRYRVEALGEYWFPRVVRPFESATGAGASIQMGAGGVRACFVTGYKRLEFPSCIAAEAGAMRAEGIGLEVSRTSHRAWMAVVAGQELVWTSRRHVGIWFAADGMLNVVRPRFVVDDLGSVFVTGWAGFRLLLGPTLRF
jgi:hypothetical protein